MFENTFNRYNLLRNPLGLQSFEMNILLPSTTHNLGFGTSSAKVSKLFMPACLPLLQP